MITICSVSMEDTEELLRIYAPYVEHSAVSFEYSVPTLEEFSERIRTISARYPYLKAVDEENRILGYTYASAFHERKAYEWSVETTIYLREDARHHGLGRMLYEALEKSLAEMGICNMNACIASPRAEDPYLTMDSIHFHTHMGFQMVGKFHNSGYKFDTWYDMVWMEKLIGSHISGQPPVCFPEP